MNDPHADIQVTLVNDTYVQPESSIYRRASETIELTPACDMNYSHTHTQVILEN